MTPIASADPSATAATAVTLHHTVSIAGVVRTGLPRDYPLPATPAEGRNLEIKRRLGGALVEIIVEEAPQAFQTMVHAKRADPQWTRRRQRIDRTWSHSDGIFFFLDLPPGEPGEGYRLRVTLPRMGTRFGVVETPLVVLPTRPTERPMRPVQVDVELPATRLHGSVTEQRLTVDNTLETLPVRGATVRIRGTSDRAETDANGWYELDQLLASRPTIEIAAPGFAPVVQRIELYQGQSTTADLQFNINDGNWQLSAETIRP